MNKQSVAVFASGNGTNALQLIRHFSAVNGPVSIDLLVCNKPDAPVVEKVKALGTEVLIADNETVENGLTLLQELHYRHIHWIVLAGFLRKIPLNIIHGFPERILNIHPSLLPKFGGQGMYGMHVHRAVVAAGEQETGITVHLVNEAFDKGRILAQFKVAVQPGDSPETVAANVQQLEHTHFPRIVESVILEAL